MELDGLFESARSKLYGTIRKWPLPNHMFAATLTNNFYFYPLPKTQCAHLQWKHKRITWGLTPFGHMSIEMLLFQRPPGTSPFHHLSDIALRDLIVSNMCITDSGMSADLLANVFISIPPTESTYVQEAIGGPAPSFSPCLWTSIGGS